MEKKWADLSPDERQEERFRRWIAAPGVKFASKKAEEHHRQTIQRLIDVIQLRAPDRVPVNFNAGFFAAHYYGISSETAMYDAEQAVQAWRKFAKDFEVDTIGGPAGVSGRPLEIMDYKLYQWPGHGVPPNATYQYVEAEYMTADEYDDFLLDPSDYWLRTYLPRVFGALSGFKTIGPLTDNIEIPMTASYLVSLGTPEVQSSLQAMLDAGKEAMKWMDSTRGFNKEMTEAGYPRVTGGFAKAPFDTLGDTLRGTRGIINDMYRQPNKVMAALDKLTLMEIKRGLNAANASGVPIVTMPLHKGADGFMSEKQFRTFYWPSLKNVALGLINEGIVPSFFAEGTYTSRLDIIKELPKGKVIWYFDQTDMTNAKEVLGKTACLQGNVPTSLICTGTPVDVKAYCKKLIETAGKGGGFILAPGAGTDEAKAENIHALLESAKEYGTYRK